MQSVAAVVVAQQTPGLSAALACILSCFLVIVSLSQDFTANKEPAMCNAAACTSNLHSLSCQLAVQAKDRGHTVHWLEDWVERALGRLSARTRGRVVRDPAHVAASIELDLRAIQTAAVLAGVQLGDDDTLLGLAVRQADIEAAIAAPSVAASCMALGKPKAFPYAVVEGEAAVRWQDVQVGVCGPSVKRGGWYGGGETDRRRCDKNRVLLYTCLAKQRQNTHASFDICLQLDLAPK
jgi:hypothetical protein